MSGHLRLHPFASPAEHSMCMAVRAGDRIFLAGGGGLTLDGSFIGPGDAAAQADEAMRTVQRLLEEAGARLEHIGKITIYLTDRAWCAPVDAAIARHLGGLAPARALLIVAGLARPEMLVAIDVEAVIP